MKIKFLLLTMWFCSISFASPMQDHQLDPAALSQLGLALNIPQETDFIAETQKQWLRQPGQERWDLTELSPEQKQFVLSWAKEQGLFAPWKPTCKQYDKALILGATTPRMQMRLNHLKQLWIEGVRFNAVVWLTGERPLDQRVDNLTGRCRNESEAAHLLWEETQLPDEMRNLPVTFIAEPMHIKGPALKRPNTEDTILAWLKTNPQPCSALFISDQPFCGYQFAVIKKCLPLSFQFDVAGQGADPTSLPATAAITLDSIARWIYQESLSK